MTNEQILNAISPETKKLIKKEYYEAFYVDDSLRDIIFFAKLLLHGVMREDGTIKEFNYKEIESIYTGNRKKIFDEIYKVIKDDLLKNSKEN